MCCYNYKILTLQILGLLDGNGGRPPLAPKGGSSPTRQGMDDASAEISVDESAVLMGKMSMTAGDEELDDDMAQHYVM